MTVLLAVLAGLLCGVLSGFGIGGGSLLMIWLTAVLSVEQRTAQAINLLFFLPTAAASLIFHVRHKQVQWRAAVPALLAGLVCAALAAWLGSHMDARLLRKLFGMFLLLVGAAELFHRPKTP